MLSLLQEELQGNIRVSPQKRQYQIKSNNILQDGQYTKQIIYIKLTKGFKYLIINSQ